MATIFYIVSSVIAAPLEFFHQRKIAHLELEQQIDENNLVALEPPESYMVAGHTTRFRQKVANAADLGDNPTTMDAP